MPGDPKRRMPCAQENCSMPLFAGVPPQVLRHNTTIYKKSAAHSPSCYHMPRTVTSFARCVPFCSKELPSLYPPKYGGAFLIKPPKRLHKARLCFFQHGDRGTVFLHIICSQKLSRSKPRSSHMLFHMFRPGEFTASAEWVPMLGSMAGRCIVRQNFIPKPGSVTVDQCTTRRVKLHTP